MHPAQAIRVVAPFRGQRDYLHSTTLFDLLRAKTGAEQGLELRIARLIPAPVKAVPLGEGPVFTNALGTFGYTDDGVMRRWVLLPDPQAPPPGRVPCNEQFIMRRARFNGDEIELVFDEGEGATFVEAVVALNKRLIEQTQAPAGKLYFSQMSLERVPSRGQLSLAVESQLGSRLFVSSVRLDGARLGKITFMAA